MPRSITDTATELEQRVSELTHIMESRDWSTFTRHHIKLMIIRAQQDAAHRTVAMIENGMRDAARLDRGRAEAGA